MPLGHTDQDTNKHVRLLIGLIYWFVLVIALPRYRSYVLEEEYSMLKDGTPITKLVHRPA